MRTLIATFVFWLAMLLAVTSSADSATERWAFAVPLVGLSEPTTSSIYLSLPGSLILQDIQSFVDGSSAGPDHALAELLRHQKTASRAASQNLGLAVVDRSSGRSVDDDFVKQLLSALQKRPSKEVFFRIDHDATRFSYHLRGEVSRVIEIQKRTNGFAAVFPPESSRISAFVAQTFLHIDRNHNAATPMRESEHFLELQGFLRVPIPKDVAGSAVRGDADLLLRVISFQKAIDGIGSKKLARVAEHVKADHPLPLPNDSNLSVAQPKNHVNFRSSSPAPYFDFIVDADPIYIVFYLEAPQPGISQELRSYFYVRRIGDAEYRTEGKVVETAFDQVLGNLNFQRALFRPLTAFRMREN